MAYTMNASKALSARMAIRTSPVARGRTISKPLSKKDSRSFTVRADLEVETNETLKSMDETIGSLDAMLGQDYIKSQESDGNRMDKARNEAEQAMKQPEAMSNLDTPKAVKIEPVSEVLQPLCDKADEYEYSVGGQRWQDLMAFKGFAPEVINGRLAMLGFVAGLGSEFSTGQSFMSQLGSNLPVALLAIALVTGASVVPAVKKETKLEDLVKKATGREAAGFGGKDFPEALAMLTPEVELMNGRVAMMGVAGLILIEAVKGSALLGGLYPPM